MVSLWCGWVLNVAHGCLYPDLLVEEAIYVLWGSSHRNVSGFQMLWFRGHDACNTTNLFAIMNARYY